MPPPASTPAPFSKAALTNSRLKNFRHELRGEPGLSSYPHPWLMQDFWQFPTVSMGIGPLNAIYQARFMKYLENRSLIPHTDRKVWAFVGDGETDEVDTLGAISLATREGLDNLIFVVNCNLQRLDGPVRGNKRIIDELEGMFRGAGWNVIKVIWGSDWDELFERDHQGLLLKRMEECVDGDFQTFKAKGGAYLRKEFFGKYPELLKLVEDKTDEQLARLHRGGHDPAEDLQRLQARPRAQGRPDGHPRQDRQGLRPRLRPGPQRHTLREEAHRRRPLRLREAVRHPAPRERRQETQPSTAPNRTTPRSPTCRPAASRWAAICPARKVPQPTFKAPELDFFKE